jgi:[NiFe] hydrogenase diaphorase moiety large subunit
MPGREQDDLVRECIDRWGRSPSRLVQILREVQEARQFLPAAVLAQVGRELGLPLAHVRGVASFYTFLSTEPCGAFRVLFSDDITDRMDGSVALMDRLCQRLWVEPGKVSEEGLVSVAATSCTGMCDQGPALLVNGRAIARLTAERIDRVCELVLERRPVPQWPRELFVVDDNVRRAGALLGHGLAPGDAIRAALERDAGRAAAAAAPSAVLEEVRRSGLRGRGGAGFATGGKWLACAAAPGASRYVVCNADEGEPGTFKDRVLLTRHADLVVEGMTVAAHAVGAMHGLLYLRGEYRYLLDDLQATLARRRAAGLLGHAIAGVAGFDFDVEIHVGAGAYVCGEETALLESLEGKRGIPRNRPPYPVTHGYLGCPTIVNNVETLCAAALIAVHGSDWFRSLGTAQSPGTKLISVSGDCARRGLYEYPFGVTIRKILEDCGATGSLAVQVGGPSGTCIADDEFERRIAFEDLSTAGAFVIFDRNRDLFEVARNYTQFFAHESCGFCTPCRVGTSMLAQVMDKIHDGKGSQHELAELASLDSALQQAAHCGLGHSACHPVLDTLQRFRPAYERRLTSLDFAPAFDLDGALATARRMTGRDDAGAHLGHDQ